MGSNKKKRTKKPTKLHHNIELLTQIYFQVAITIMQKNHDTESHGLTSQPDVNQHIKILR